MEKQANEVTLSFVESFEAYASDSKAMGELKTRLEDSRKILEPVIRAHKLPVEPKAENVKAWKAKRDIFLPLVQELEWPRDEEGEKMERVTISDTELKRMDARIVAWLGVIKTCLELQILPTDKNADRLRKARMWTALNGNGKLNPNWVDPKAPKPETATATATPTTATPTTATPTTATPTTATPTTATPITQPQATAKAPSKGTTTQKQETPIHPLHASVSSSDAPISSTEHFTSLWMQLSKNDTFKLEFIDMIAAGLEVPRATLTTVMWQSAEQIIRGVK